MPVYIGKTGLKQKAKYHLNIMLMGKSIQSALFEMNRQYRTLDHLGKGTFAQVYLVRDAFGDQYALKMIRFSKLSAKQKQNSMAEVRILRSIKSNYIVKLKNSWLKAGQLCLLLQYCKGGDLSKKLKRSKIAGVKFHQRQFWRLAIQMLLALSKLHKNKIIHRDVKPANIFITSTGYKLADFNVAKQTKSGLFQTQTGTPFYAAPQIWQNKKYSFNADSWSLGVCLYQAFFGRVPFQAASRAELKQKIVQGNLQMIPKGSLQLRQLISLLLTTNNQNRPTCQQALQMSFVAKKRIEYDVADDSFKVSRSISASGFNRQTTMLKRQHSSKVTRSQKTICRKQKQQNPEKSGQGKMQAEKYFRLYRVN